MIACGEKDLTGPSEMAWPGKEQLPGLLVERFDWYGGKGFGVLRFGQDEGKCK